MFIDTDAVGSGYIVGRGCGWLYVRRKHDSGDAVYSLIVFMVISNMWMEGVLSLFITNLLGGVGALFIFVG